MKTRQITAFSAITLSLLLLFGTGSVCAQAKGQDALSPSPLNEATGSYARRSRLKGINLALYDELAKAIKKIASGDSNSGSIRVTINLKNAMGSAWKDSYTANDLGVTSLVSNGTISTETENAMNRLFAYDPTIVSYYLLSDMPYELYWYDKTKGWSGPANIAAYMTDGTTLTVDQTTTLTFNFRVSKSYSASGNAGTTAINTTKTKNAAAALKNAKDFVDANKSKSDYEKLQAYKTKICDLTSYNTAAAQQGAAYDDAYQVIYVFDGNPTTNVVCEGYAKAFKYLCDISTFSSNKVYCQLVTGNMSGGTGAGEHMWNIVHMSDDKNYLVDVTNCDTGTIGAPDKLFLVGGNKNGNTQYTTTKVAVTYAYDNDTIKQFSSAELALASTNYQAPSSGNGDSGNGNSGNGGSGNSGNSGSSGSGGSGNSGSSGSGGSGNSGNSGSSGSGGSGNSGNSGSSGSGGSGNSGNSGSNGSGNSGNSGNSGSGGSSNSGTENSGNGNNSGNGSGSSGNSSSGSGSSGSGNGNSSGNSSSGNSSNGKTTNNVVNNVTGNGGKLRIVVDGIEINIDNGNVTVKNAGSKSGSKKTKTATFSTCGKNKFCLDKSPTGVKSVTIPKKVTSGGKTYTVTKIGSGAFKNNTKITRAELPSSITSVSKGAFTGAKNLKTIVIRGGSNKTFNKIVKMIKSSSNMRSAKFVHVK